MLIKNKFIGFSKFIASLFFTSSLIFSGVNLSHQIVAKQNQKSNQTNKLTESDQVVEVPAQLEWQHISGTNKIIITGCSNWQTCTSLTIPATINGDNVVEIRGSDDDQRGGAFFKNNFSTVNFSQAKYLTKIGKRAFKDCVNLKAASITPINPTDSCSIEDYAFQGCTSLASVTLGRNISETKTQSFAKLKALTSLTIENGVKIIGFQAFMNCSNLPSVVIPDSVQILKGGCFQNCSSLSSLHLGTGIEEIHRVAFENDGLTSVSLEGLDQLHFANEQDVRKYDCTGIFKLNTHLTDINLGALDFFPTEMFAYCTAINELRMSTAHQAFEDHAFINAEIKRLIIPNDFFVNSVDEKNIGFEGCKIDFAETYENDPNDRSQIWYCYDDNGNKIGGYYYDPYYFDGGRLGPMAFNAIAFGKLYFGEDDPFPGVNGFWDDYTELEPPLFDQCNGITEVTIEKEFNLNITHHDLYQVFYNCKNLKRINVNYTEKELNNGFNESLFFNDDSSIGSVTVAIHHDPSVQFNTILAKYIAKWGQNNTIYVDGNGNSQKWRITENNTAYPIFGESFSGEVVVPTTIRGQPVYTIGSGAFEDNQAITSVVIPDGIKAIDDIAFNHCANLVSVKLPQHGLQRIGNSAFYNCVNLRNLEISTDTEQTEVLAIEDRAFANCPIETLTIDYVKNMQIENSSFRNVQNVVFKPADIAYAVPTNKRDLINKYRGFFYGTNNFSTWFDTSIQLESSYNIYNLNDLRLNLGEGFSVWKKAHPGPLGAKFIPDQTTSQYLNFSGSINLTNPLNSAMDINVNVIKPPLSSWTASVIPVFNMVGSREIQLDPITFNVDANIDYSASNPSFTPSDLKSHTGVGLWVGNDTYSTTLTINKAFFKNDWNNPQSIKNNIINYLQFFDANNNVINFTNIKQGVYFSNQVGLVQATNITVTGPYHNLYAIDLKISVPINKTMALKTQDIKIKFNDSDAPRFLTTIHTFSGDSFDPNVSGFNQTVPTVIINKDDKNANVNWTLNVEQQFSYLFPNSLTWWIRHDGWSMNIDASQFNNDFIGINNTVSLSDDGHNLSGLVQVKKTSILEQKINVTSLRLLVSKAGQTTKTINLPDFKVVLNPANDLELLVPPTLSTNSALNNGRDGLWMPNDNYTVTIKANKAYFLDHRDQPDFIKTNFDQFLLASSQSGVEYEWTKTKIANTYFNPLIGNMIVRNISSVDVDHYTISLLFITPNDQTINYLTQTINFTIKNSQNPIFSLKTLNRDEFDVNNEALSIAEGYTVNLTHDDRSGIAYYQANDQEQWANLNGNTFKWAKANGYKLLVDTTQFHNDYIKIDDLANFDLDRNVLGISVKQVQPILNAIAPILVENLTLNIVGYNGKVIKGIRLDHFKVTLEVAYKEVHVDQGSYRYSGSNPYSLNENGDRVTFDTLIPHVLVPNDLSHLIDNLNFYYEQDIHRWNWKLISNKEGIYTFKTLESEDQYQLTYYQKDSLTSSINPIIRFNFTLTQLFNGKKKNDIHMDYDNASKTDVDINADEYTPPPSPQPTPASVILLKWIPVIGGIIGGIVLIGIISNIIYRKYKYDHYLKSKYKKEYQE